MNTYSRVKLLAEQQKMSIAEVERKLNLSNGQIKRWEKSAPNGNHLNAVADFFNVSTDFLLGRDEDDNAELPEYRVLQRLNSSLTEEQREKAIKIIQLAFNIEEEDDSEDDI